MASQALLNMGLVFGLVQIANRYNIDAPENTMYLRLGYGTVQVITLAIVGWIYLKVRAAQDKTQLVYNDVKNPFDPSDKEVVKTTNLEYDTEQTRTLLTQTLTTIAMIVFMHLQWGYLRPMLLQTVLGFRTLWSNALFKVYILGQPATGALARPWKTMNTFGQTAGPTPKELKAKEKKEAKKKINRVD